MLFHPHILEIKTCLASAKARLAAKSRENARTRGLCRSPRASPCVTHPVPVPRPAGPCPCAVSPLPQGCPCQPGAASASLCSSRAREGAVCLSVCLMISRCWEGAGKSQLQPPRAPLLLFEHRNLAARFFFIFSLVGKLMKLIFLWLDACEQPLAALPLSHQELFLSPPLQSPAWLRLPFAFRNPSPLRGCTFPNGTGLEAANEKCRHCTPGENPQEQLINVENKSASAKTGRCSFGIYSREGGAGRAEVWPCCPSPVSARSSAESSSDHKPGTGLQTDGHTDTELAQPLCSKAPSRWGGRERLPLCCSRAG